MKLIKNLNFKKILSLFLKQEGTPFFNAKGVAVGVFCGCFPFFGFQTLLGLFLARVAKGNLFLAAIGTWISNPFTYVPLYFFNYKVGSFLLRNPTDIVLDKNLLIEELWEQGRVFSLKLILGSALVGLLLASISGMIIFLLYKLKIKKRVL
ncbi:Uncharacterized protein conserved in bacteria [Prochlorococcus marinus str. MIT 9515]|uniref:Uncharacterized protein conserved in bacteria n=1 Tax=Prochlorococcus marinus (strain MIT 9515) TaxID=167542 RepID=A2BUG7_PROM5|nr:DUF2062 domain-containing protein [Prochlorococcus marinus]ABM71428.1 Uncharacterized protein conserved in bacteria [Prochlorococcus marinus str. MIT 9515]